MEKKVWHKKEDIPENDRMILLISCMGKKLTNVEVFNTKWIFECSLKNVAGECFLKYMDAFKCIAWAYIEDLIDEETQCYIKKEAEENFDEYSSKSRAIDKEWRKFLNEN